MRRKRRPRKPRHLIRPDRSPPLERFLFRLCITGMTARSRAAILNIRHLCRTHLAGRYRLEIVDLYQHPELARLHDIVATPTLIKEAPTPVCRLLGSLCDHAQALKSLGIPPAD